jgi:hypothetical protein
MKNSMLLIIVLELFAMIALVAGDGDCENPTMKNFDFNKVGIIVLILFPKQAAAEKTDWVNISFVIPLTKFK